MISQRLTVPPANTAQAIQYTIELTKNMMHNPDLFVPMNSDHFINKLLALLDDGQIQLQTQHLVLDMIQELATSEKFLQYAELY